MISLFLVTSAIHTPYGKISTKDRIQQTKETLQSIQKYTPNSHIVLLDCGEKSVDKNLFDCEVIDYTDHKEIQFYKQKYLSNCKNNHPEILLKSMMEIMMIEDYLKINSVDSYKRIFKLSGRYKLNSKFNYTKHLEAKDKVLILPPFLSGYFYNLEVTSSILMYSTRCWSFDATLALNILNTYGKMKKNIIRILQRDKIGDVEHLLYRHIDKGIVNHIDVMGVEGIWALQGSTFIE